MARRGAMGLSRRHPRAGLHDALTRSEARPRRQAFSRVDDRPGVELKIFNYGVWSRFARPAPAGAEAWSGPVGVLKQGRSVRNIKALLQKAERFCACGGWASGPLPTRYPPRSPKGDRPAPMRAQRASGARAAKPPFFTPADLSHSFRDRPQPSPTIGSFE